MSLICLPRLSGTMALHIRRALEPAGRDFVFPLTKAEAAELGIRAGASVRLRFAVPPKVDAHGLPMISIEILSRARKGRQRLRSKE